MDKIKGLLIKDFLELKAYKKNFILTIFIYIILLILNSSDENMISMGTAMIIFLFSIYSVATFSYDEKTNSNMYFLTMPITKRDIVLAKYIFVVIGMILGVFTSILVSIILYYIGFIKVLDFSQYFSFLLGIIFAISLLQCIKIPCIYKYGAEKGRLQVYIISMIIFIAIWVVYKLFPNVNLDYIEKFAPIIFLFLTLFNYFVSYKLSIKIFKNKEI